jgi:hypothetical protein
MQQEQSSTQISSGPGHPDGLAVSGGGSKDGTGFGDHDRPFGGFQAYHFSSRQMLRLLLLRSEALDGRMGIDPYEDEVRSV